MSTKNTIRLMRVVGILLPVLVLLGARTGVAAFYVVAAVSAFLGFGALCYAAFRERTVGDKSEGVPPATAIAIFCVLGVWLVFVACHALNARP